MISTSRRFLAAILIIIGILAVIAGVLYVTQPAHSLPSFFPGYLAHGVGKHTKRGIAGVVVGAVLVVISLVLLATGRRGRRPRHRR